MIRDREIFPGSLVEVLGIVAEENLIPEAGQPLRCQLPVAVMLRRRIEAGQIPWGTEIEVAGNVSRSVVIGSDYVLIRCTITAGDRAAAGFRDVGHQLRGSRAGGQGNRSRWQPAISRHRPATGLRELWRDSADESDRSGVSVIRLPDDAEDRRQGRDLLGVVVAISIEVRDLRS